MDKKIISGNYEKILNKEVNDAVKFLDKILKNQESIVKKIFKGLNFNNIPPDIAESNIEEKAYIAAENEIEKLIKNMCENLQSDMVESLPPSLDKNLVPKLKKEFSAQLRNFLLSYYEGSLTRVLKDLIEQKLNDLILTNGSDESSSAGE